MTEVIYQLYISEKLYNIRNIYFLLYYVLIFMLYYISLN